MTKRLFAAALLSSAVIFAGPVACSQTTIETEAVSAPGTELGIRKDWMDLTADPGSEFYRYALGSWLDSAEIPADRTAIGAFSIADERTEEQLDMLIQEIVASDHEPGSEAAKIKDFYLSYLDVEAINAAGLAPIRPDLDRFAAIADKQQLARVMGSQTRADVDPLNYTDYHTGNLFGVFVTQALKGGEVVPYILQGGLGMPERQYYLSDSEAMVSNRAAYRKYLRDIFAAAGYEDADVRATRVYDLEMKIARAHATREETNDWISASQLWDRAQFSSKAPGLDWTAFFAAANLDRFDTFNAYHPNAIPRLAALVDSEPLDAWKDWLIFHQLDENAAVLPTRFDDLSFAFHGKTLAGAQEKRSRAKRAQAAIDAYLGDALGKLYVEKHFPPGAKAEISVMVDNIKQAFAKRIARIDWMAESTKQEAIKKATTMEVGVGYPDDWVDYSDLEVSPDNAYANRVAATKFNYRRELAKVGKPLDRGEWWMNAQLVNAINLPVQNAMNFPAAILQPPFYDRNADPAFNYGAIGAVIGHEISHSFDNNGAEFDSSGAMRNWWTDADKLKFNQAGKALADQYDSYRPFDDLAVNGTLTLGENIADVAGLAAAYDAYRASLGGKEAPVIGGFTGDQRFFIAYAQAWASKMREPRMRQIIATDGHAPGQYRALTVRNLDPWYEAFAVTEDDALYLAPEDRVKIW